MGACPSCGASSVEGARFCAVCGAIIVAPDAPDPLAAVGHESRRVVTVIFADVVGSTTIAERLDPEAARTVLSRFFEVARTTLTRHGGTVEKYVGDAVMAVFGIPELHEDDALRAARAAVELRERMASEAEWSTARLGSPLTLRIGLDTGEVVVADPATGTTLVTGDTVNVAARLQAAATPGEILIGPETSRLIRGSAAITPLEPLTVKGRSEAVRVARLDGPVTGTDARRAGGPFVGRASELGRLEATVERVVKTRTPGLVTVVGPPGAGKSRLANELAMKVDGKASLLRGRCLSYGEGITYWPLGEIVREASGITDHDSPLDARSKVISLIGGDDPDAAVIAGRIAAIIGLDPSGAVAEETPWSVRRLVEILAGRGPLVIVLDDLQWAEPALLDLLEYVLGWATPIPFLLVCLARPELRDRRPDWGEAVADATTIRLGSLEAVDTGSLLDRLAGSPLPTAARERLVRVSDGNPLFAEELLTMLLEEGHLRREGELGWVVLSDIDHLAMPPTIGALLAARLDRLPADEREVLERSSVVGEQFDRVAAVELADPPERAAVSGRLLALVRRELLRPDRSDLTGGEAFRFRHLLVRDAAYEALPKAERAILHERLADWLVRVAGDRLAEVEAIVGYHYDQAQRYRGELAPGDPRIESLARRAAGHLIHAGQRSMELGDAAGAATTLGRGVSLLPKDDPSRLRVVGDLTIALAQVGRLDEAEALLDEADAEADRIDEAELRLRIEADLALSRPLIRQQMVNGIPSATALVERLEASGDHLGLAKALHALSLEAWFALEDPLAEAARERARAEARLADDRRLERLTAYWGATWYGAEPIEIGRGRYEAELAEAGSDRFLRAGPLINLAGVRSMAGDIDGARMALAEAQAIFEDLHLRLYAAGICEFVYFVEHLVGDPRRAEASLRAGTDALRAMGATGYLAGDLARLAMTLARTGAVQEARSVLEEVDGLGQVTPEVPGLRAEAVAAIEAAEGRPEAAARACQEAAGIFDRTENWLCEAAYAHLLLAGYRAASGDRERALVAVRWSFGLYERKGHLVGMAQARELLTALADG
jgi:class 3 adenylate cyclase